MTQTAAAMPPVRTPRCLLVEEDELGPHDHSDFDQKRIARILARGTRVELKSVATLRSARRYLANEHFDLVLLDNNLPDGLGVDFAAEIRRTKGMEDVPILMVSDWPTPFMYDKAANARISRVLSKDEFQPQHVREALRFARVIAMSRQ